MNKAGFVIVSIAALITYFSGSSATKPPFVSAAGPVPSPTAAIAAPSPPPLGKVICEETQYDLLSVDSTDRRDRNNLKLVRKDSTVINEIEMPTDDEFQGFAVDLANPRKRGFQIAVEWGTRIFHHLDFDFDCKQSGFYLSKTTHFTFDKHYPENEKLYKTRIKKITPPLPLNKFAIRDFMVD